MLWKPLNLPWIPLPSVFCSNTGASLGEEGAAQAKLLGTAAALLLESSCGACVNSHIAAQAGPAFAAIARNNTPEQEQAAEKQEYVEGQGMSGDSVRIET